MSSRNFPEALDLVLEHEGGFVNHPKDPGGATNKGITQYTYNMYRKAHNLLQRSVAHITESEVAYIYLHRYWHEVRGDELPSGVDYAVFDFAVHSGPYRAVQYLQRVVGVDDDGVIGPITLKAVRSMDPSGVIRTLLDRRLAYLKRLDTWITFGRGWSRRLVGVRREALGMVSSQTKPLPFPPVTDPGPPRPTEPGRPVGAPSLRILQWGMGIAIIVIGAVVVMNIFDMGIADVVKLVKETVT